ncbi:MAG TPA: alpha/beta hydrolase [Rectinemataceae bacterium]|nr:alpha/beta hydrolase [Rectinemataceae bacterium]
MEGHFVEVEGLRWHYTDRGAGSPILFVHGNTGSSAWWARTMDIRGHRAVAPDLPNFGLSGALPGEISIEAYAGALAAFIVEMGLEGAVAVGHSLGGSVCLALAAMHEELLGGLVLVDSSSPKGLVTAESQYPAIESMHKDRSILAAALKAVAPTLADAALFESLVDDAMKMAAPAWIGNALALSRFDVSAALGGWTKPVLVIWGRKDVIITEAMARETRDAFREARLEIIEGVGHSVIVEDPERFKSLLRGYLERPRRSLTGLPLSRKP